MLDSFIKGMRLRSAGVVVGLAVAIAVTRQVEASDAALPRVRSTTPYIAAVISEGSKRSVTFGRLIEIIEATDGIVYVEPGRCGHGVRGCLTHSITTAGSFRLLRILVDTRLGPLELVGSIAHELQHAVEVLHEPGLVADYAVYLFYMRIAQTQTGTFETAEAIKTGLRVENEVASSVPGKEFVRTHLVK